MFSLTNAQRECFALAPVSERWERIEAKPSPHDSCKTHLFFDGDTLVKCIVSGDARYCEYELSEKVSPDRRLLLPKTAKGKPVPLSASAAVRRGAAGMGLSCGGGDIRLYNARTECAYYSNHYLNDDIRDLDGFARWVEDWCAETTEADRADVLCFSQRERRHVRYREGDVFRFKIGRRLYGYGRILLDFNRMRKQKEPFWDILMTRPLVCSVYRMATDRDDVSLDELARLGSLPSTVISDNSLFYGEHEIIGNLPIAEREDYPIMYGESIRAGERAVCYQCGHVFRKVDHGTALYDGFIHNSVSLCFLNFKLDVLLQCIKENSNAPYWNWVHDHARVYDHDLRDPKHAEKLQKVRAQFGL